MPFFFFFFVFYIYRFFLPSNSPGVFTLSDFLLHMAWSLVFSGLRVLGTTGRTRYSFFQVHFVKDVVPTFCSTVWINLIGWRLYITVVEELRTCSTTGVQYLCLAEAFLADGSPQLMATLTITRYQSMTTLPSIVEVPFVALFSIVRFTPTVGHGTVHRVRRAFFLTAGFWAVVVVIARLCYHVFVFTLKAEAEAELAYLIVHRVYDITLLLFKEL